MDARKFLFVCAGVLCLAVAYHLGATRSEAQGGIAQFAGIAAVTQGGNTGYVLALTTEGDLYVRSGHPICNGNWTVQNCDWTLVGSVFGGPVPIEDQSFGRTKAQHR